MPDPDPHQRAALTQREQRIDPQQIDQQYVRARDEHEPEQRLQRRRRLDGTAQRRCDAARNEPRRDAQRGAEDPFAQRFAAPPRGMAEVCRHVARGGEEPAVDNEHREEDGCNQSDPIALRCRARAALEVGRRCPQEPERDRDDQRAEREARAIRIQRTECVGTESRG